ncbi:polyamine aminopropyltransferase [Streptomyces sp. XM4193]|uniref:polyamine aminopropyltransferase n=1 Tax=Streptomyces sp. XM4193 TaxID=2929782 RepID=UPI001FF7539F|nr:polyamine aminopropyltransferase [Streptomyces sp. XM4193]MCK1794932.1 polyamine aminopropyltransferase [Streptomyces sp. XM4193]
MIDKPAPPGTAGRTGAPSYEPAGARGGAPRSRPGSAPSPAAVPSPAVAPSPGSRGSGPEAGAAAATEAAQQAGHTGGPGDDAQQAENVKQAQQAGPADQAQQVEQVEQVEQAESAGEGVRLPVRPGVGRLLVLASVFVCAACGLVYELELVALASYLAGDSITQASVVLSMMVFAMGIGSLLAKRLCARAAAGFGFIEALLALVGGGSVMALHACFAWFGESRTALVVFSLLIGVLIGAEMPLLMVLIQRIREQDIGGAVADLFAADYVGALVGGLAFPFLLLPMFGQLTGALLVGVVNVFAGGVVVLWLFRHELSRRTRNRLLLANALVLALLLGAVGASSAFEEAARRAVYGSAVRVAVQSEYQEIVLTDGAAAGERAAHADPDSSLELFLDGRLRVCSSDEARHHQGLVHPAMATGRRERVLVLGGGDGLALREVLRHSDVSRVTVVDRDPELFELARRDPKLSTLNEGAHDDPRVRRVSADPFRWLRDHLPDGDDGDGDSGGGDGDGDGDSGGDRDGGGPYDVIVSALPDPRLTTSTKLYSLEFYGLLGRSLAEGGRLAVHAGPVAADPRTFWTIDATLRAAGLVTTPYALDGRLSGFGNSPDRPQRSSAEDPPKDWGFLLGARSGEGGATAAGGPALRLSGSAHRPDRLTEDDLRRAAATAADHRHADLPASTLLHPRF